MPAERVLVAEIGPAHGLRGEVRLRVFTEQPAALKRFGPLLDDAGGSHALASIRTDAKGAVARLRGIDDRNAAERLRGTRLYVPRARLPKPDADEFYYADLIGLEARLADGTVLGTVTTLHDFGAGDILEIVPHGGGTATLLPFTKAAVPQVEVAAGYIVVDPPAEVEARGDDEDSAQPASEAPSRSEAP